MKRILRDPRHGAAGPHAPPVIPADQLAASQLGAPLADWLRGFELLGILPADPWKELPMGGIAQSPVDVR